MKTSIKNLFLPPALIAGLGLILASGVTAQTFTNLHSFTTLSGSINSDGAWPAAGLILSGNTLYGMTAGGGGSGYGTVFAVNTDGTGFTNLYSFTNGDVEAYSDAGLILSGSTLYGTASGGGSSGEGMVFRVNTNGSGFYDMYDFSVGSFGYSSSGTSPNGLILSGNTLYGTTTSGGAHSYGTVFAVNINTLSFTSVYSFTGGSGGANPDAGLVLSGSTLYGTTSTGGNSGGGSHDGTVFAVNTNGSFTTLYSFTAVQNTTNGDGAGPEAGLILSGNTLYGTAPFGGSSGEGTVFGVILPSSTNGLGFTNVYNFNGSSSGANPYAGLLLSSNTLYGTTYGGGSSGYGTVFAVSSDGTNFTTLYNFTNGTDGANPYAVLTLSGSTLYGTARYGGSSGNGTIFSLSLIPPQPTIVDQPQSVVVNAYGTASFNLTVSGATPLSYQWSFNGSNIAGATSNSLTISNVVQTNLGTYAVFAENAFGTTNSSNATLSMYPFLVAPFTGLDTYWGYTNILSVGAWGTGPLDYQWFDDGNAINGATNETLTLTGVQFTNAGVYSVVVSSALGSVTNAPEQVVVNPAGVSFGGLYPSIIIQGVVGYNYIIQSTANLSDTNFWVTVTNLTLTQPIQLWIDSNTDAALPANPNRFYKVLPGQ